MLAKRIIPCLDVRDGRVVKGVRFRDHKDAGDIVELAHYYSEQGADELVFYDITASSDRRNVDRTWVRRVAEVLDIPFSVGGGIKTVADAADVLDLGAEKISVNSPAIERPELIDELVRHFGSQCVVIGVDSKVVDGSYRIHKYTGREETTTAGGRNTLDWLNEVQARGAGEVVLNCMDSDGVRNGYDITHLAEVSKQMNIPVIASGGAGRHEHFLDAFVVAGVDGTLAAGAFHSRDVHIPELRLFLRDKGVLVRSFAPAL